MYFKNAAAVICVISVATCNILMLPRFNSNETHLSTTINEIINVDARKNIFLVNFNDLQPEFPHTQINLRRPNSIRLNNIKTNIYVVNLNGNKTEYIFQFLRRQSSWNSRAKFIIYSKMENFRHIFDLLSKFYVYDVIIFQKKLYTYNPYKHSDIFNVDTTPVLYDSKIKILPQTWDNTTLSVALVAVAPYVLCTNCVQKGLELEILDLIRSRLKFKLNFLPNFVNWGQRNQEGVYNNAYGAIQQNEAHIGLGMFQMEHNSSQDFDLSFPYLIDNLIFVIPRKDLLKDVFILDVYVWVLILFFYGVICVLWYKLSYYTGENAYFRSFSTILLLTFRILLGSSLGKIPRKLAGRLLFLFWCTSTWILCIEIQSYLFYFLTHDRHQKEINSIYELADSDLDVGLYVHLQETFRDSQGDTERKIYEKIVECNLDEFCINRVVLHKDMAVVRPKRTITYEIPSFYLDFNGNPLIQPIEESIMMRYVNICFKKGIPMFLQVDDLLQRIKSSGFVVHWDKMYINYINRIHFRNVIKNINFNSKALTIVHLGGVFCLFLIGLIISLICLGLEILIYKCY